MSNVCDGSDVSKGSKLSSEEAANAGDESRAWMGDLAGTSMSPLAGGYSGETFLIGTGDEQCVVRIYARDPRRALIDASLLRLMRGLLPVPEVVEVRPAYGANPAVLVTECLRGARLDLVLPGLDQDGRVTVGRHLGHALGVLSGIPQLRFGAFVDEELLISRRGTPTTDLAQWAQHFRDSGRLASWTQRDWTDLLDLVDTAEDVLATARPADRHVLVHSDFNPKNLLVDPESLELTGVLDWEFAHAGSPYTDLGNLTRFERHPDLVESLVAAWSDTAPQLASGPLRLGRAVDLWALIELAGNERANAVRELAGALLLAQARERDLDAWPWSTPRVDPAASSPVPW